MQIKETLMEMAEDSESVLYISVVILMAGLIFIACLFLIAILIVLWISWRITHAACSLGKLGFVRMAKSNFG